MTIKEASIHAGVCQGYIYRMIREKRIRPVPRHSIRDPILIYESEINRFIKERRGRGRPLKRKED